MKVKSGYKQTDVGVIPEDWDMRRLSDDITLLSGHHVLARDCNTDGDGVAYITGPADFQNGVIQHTKFTTRPGTICDAKDILVTVKGSGAGTTVLSDGAYCISRQLMAVRVHSWSRTYVYFSLLRAASLFGAAATGLIPGLSRGDVLDMGIPLPPTKAEQEAIADVLSDADALIESLEQFVAKKRLLKQGAMQELLTGEMRLPGYEVKPGYQQTEVGVIPEDWLAASISDFAGGKKNIVDGPFGSNLKNSDFTSNGVPVLQGLNITGDKFTWKEVRFISEVKAKDLFRSNARVGDLLSVKIGSVGFSALIDSLDGHQFAIIPANLLRVRFAKDAGDARFAYFALTSFQAKQRLKDLAGNTAQPALSLAGFRRFFFPSPPTKAEQTAIAEILSDMDLEIAALEAKLAKTRQLKRGMMRELLTGRIRLI